MRWLAEGRDPSATLENGNPGREGLLGVQIPNLWNSSGKWRWFYTQQHGDNFTWQVVLASQHQDDENDNDQ